jgi:hypothetical protein
MGRRHEAADRDVVDQHALALLDEVRERSVRAVQAAEQIDPDGSECR